ncbi:MAG: tetratricopeptide repeat protein, partial [Tepidisphaeraceae bacterium]
DPMMARGYYHRGMLFAKQLKSDAAIADFSKASEFYPNNALLNLRLAQCYQLKGEVILASKYGKEANGNHAKLAQEQESFLGQETEFVFKPRDTAEFPRDYVLGPLEKGKRELEKKLDATVD